MTPKRKRKHYFGNYPNNPDYEPNIPLGWNQWDNDDAMEDDDNNNHVEPDEPEIRDDEHDTDWK